MSIYIYTLLVCLSVRLYPINVKMAQFLKVPHVTPGNVLDDRIFKNLLLTKLDF